MGLSIRCGLFGDCRCHHDEKIQPKRRKDFLLGMGIQFALSFSFLSLAMQEIAMATAYAIWTGIGAAGGVAVSILFFGESKSLKKLFFVALIIVAVVGLKLVG